MKLGKPRKRTLKIKVGGNKVQITSEGQSEEVQFLEKLDREFSLLNNVFKCLSEVDKSIYPDWGKKIIISFRCPRFCGGKEFCKKVISSMEAELTEKMELETRIDKGGFVDYDRI